MWNPNCPERLRLIQTEQSPATTQPRRERAATPRRQTISVTVPSVSGSTRIVSFAETLKGAQKRAPTPKPQRERRPPRVRKPSKTVEQPLSPAGRGKFPQGEERPSTSRQVDGEGETQSRNKENGFCTNTNISCASTSKGDSNPL